MRSDRQYTDLIWFTQFQVFHFCHQRAWAIMRLPSFAGTEAKAPDRLLVVTNFREYACPNA
jgi:hypothetical protein